VLAEAAVLADLGVVAGGGLQLRVGQVERAVVVEHVDLEGLLVGATRAASLDRDELHLLGGTIGALLDVEHRGSGGEADQGQNGSGDEAHFEMR